MPNDSARTAPAGPPLYLVPADRRHVVQFYENDAFLARVTAAYVSEGLAAGEPVVAIATRVHLVALASALRSRGVELDQELAAGRCTLLEAEETLAAFMVDGRPVPARFEEVIGGLIRRLEAGSPSGHVRAFGEMVDVLCLRGERAAALELEALWNDLGRRHSFALLCGYAISAFDGAGLTDSFAGVCTAHSHVVPTEACDGVSATDEQLALIARLQQRARALEREVESRKQAERELQAALRQRDDFIAIAGHELKSPLASAQLQVQSLQVLVRRRDDPMLLERLGKAARSIGRLGRLVDDLLDASRLDSGHRELEREPVDLAGVVAEVLEAASVNLAQAGCRVELEVPEAVVGEWDRVRLLQVVGNLVSNALKYGAGKPISITVVRAGDDARLVVRDHGIGMDGDSQRRVFERFERAVSARHFGGLGLGLYIVRQVVEAHRGTVRVESAPGEGATFVVELPLRA